MWRIKMTTNRRSLLKIAAAGAAGAAGSAAVALTMKPGVAIAAAGAEEGSVSVSFGVWMTPVDRYPNNSPAAAGHHVVIPNEVKIKAGSAVNFIISGLHQVIIYDNGVQPSNINTALTRPTTGTPAGVPLINDPAHRIYAGLDPSLQARDRVEVVHFPVPGTFLVICGVLPHFQVGMYGFVRVLP
jgi:plastocyanin